MTSGDRGVGQRWSAFSVLPRVSLGALPDMATIGSALAFDAPSGDARWLLAVDLSVDR